MHKEHHTPGTDIDGGIQVMHHDNPAHPERSIKEGYEITDMNSRIIVISLIGLLILMWGACVVIVMVIRGFNESDLFVKLCHAVVVFNKNLENQGCQKRVHWLD